MNIKYLNSVFLFLLCSCTISPAKKIKFNNSLLLELSSAPNSKDAHPYPVPYYVKFKKGKKELFYVAAEHSSNVNGSTHQIVRSLLLKENLEAVVVELPTDNQEILKKFLADCNLSTKCAEGPFTFILAEKQRIDSEGGEPTDA